jgi:hypothetical protein
MALVTMSKEELDRFSIIRDVIARRMKPRAVADILGISRRQLLRGDNQGEKPATIRMRMLRWGRIEGRA